MPLMTALSIADFVAKSFLVLSMTAVVAFVLRRKSAATGHRVWTLGFAVLLLMPAAGLLLPQRRVEVVPAVVAHSSPIAARSSSQIEASVGAQSIHPASILSAGTRPERAATGHAISGAGQRRPVQTGPFETTPVETASRRFLPLPSMMLGVWALMALLILARLAIHQAILGRILRRCAPLTDGEWISSLAEAARRLKLARPVRLVMHAAAATPATAGTWRPSVLLPADAGSWSASRRQSVLLHELAHVKRRDVLTQLAAGVVCAIHWFNPLAWYGLAQMRKLRELACDDLVLAGGQQPSDYAATLLDVARTYRPRRLAGAVGMARGTNVERRIVAVLDGARNRLPMSRRARTGLAMIAVALILGLGSVRLATRTAAADESTQSKQATATETPPQASKKRTMDVFVADESGALLRGAKIYYSLCYKAGGKTECPHGTLIADENGRVSLAIPSGIELLRFWASKTGYVPEFTNFSKGAIAEGEKLPARYEFRLAPATTLSGRIVDESGKPIAGAKVEVSVEVHEPAWGANPEPMISHWLTDEDFNRPAPITDSDGRWSIDDAPAAKGTKDYEFRLKITHNEYASDSRWAELQRAQGITTKMLRDGTATIVLKPGVTVEGTVVGPGGKPVTKGLVIWSDHPYWADGVNEAPIDGEGHFKTIPLKPGEYPITVAAPGYQPVQQKMQIKAGMQPLRFELAPGKKFVMKFVDRQGRAIPNVYVRIGGWRGTEALYNDKHSNVPESGIPRNGNKDGVYAWDWAPEDAVTYQISKRGYAEQSVALVAKDTPHVVTLPDDRVAAGMVTDAQTGKPVANFSAMPVIVFRPDFYHTRREDAKPGRDGHYELPLTGSGDPNDRYRVRFEAEGYQSLVSEESFGPLDGRATLNASLQPAPARIGQVVDAEGQPVAKAMVLEASPTDVPTVSKNEPEYGANPIRTDEQGRFELLATSESVLIRVYHDRGFAEVRREPGQPVGKLRLRPWARVEGRLVQDGRPVANQLIIFSPIPAGKLLEPRFQDSYQVHTDAEGKFVYDRLPPVVGNVRTYLGPWQESPLTSAESAPLDLQPGEKRTVVLGGEGAAVTGKVVPTGRGDVPLDAHWSLNYLVSRDRGVRLPANFPKLSFAPGDGKPIEAAWLDDPSYQEWQATRDNYFVKLSPEGTLHVSGVSAGRYDLVIQLYEQPAGCLVQTVGRKVVPVVVSDADVSAGEKSIGAIEVPCRVGPRVGENMQAYKFVDADGREQTVFDMQGRFVLLHVWASWCGPCLETLPNVKASVEELADKPVTFVGLNIDADSKQAQSLAAAKGWRWAQTYVGEKSGMMRQLAVSSAPAYFLIGPDGKLISSSTEWRDIKKTLEASLGSRAK